MTSQSATPTASAIVTQIHETLGLMPVFRSKALKRGRTLGHMGALGVRELGATSLQAMALSHGQYSVAI